jgi:hypothetical protein
MFGPENTTPLQNRQNFGQQREKVTFEPNVPRIIALEYNDGTPTTSQKSGLEQWQYFLGGHCIMWADPDLREAILRTGAKAGDSVCITKRANKRGARWEVQLVSDETQYGATDADLPPQLWPPAHTDAPRAGTFAQRLANDQAARTAAPYKFAPRPEAIAAARKPAIRAAPVPAPLPDWAERQLAQQAEKRASFDPRAVYDDCLRSAIDAAIAAQQYAAEKGVQLDFTAEDIRTIAATLFIQERGK